MVRDQKPLELTPEEKVDPTQQDRRHGIGSVTLPLVIEKAYSDGLEHARAGRYFEAHEAFEDAWRAADADERDFFQGLVHVVVAWYQQERGNLVGCERQLAKAERRLASYSPAYRGVDVASLLAQVAAGRPGALAPLDLAEAEGVEHAPESDVQPPLPVEEEQQTEGDEDQPTRDA